VVLSFLLSERDQGQVQCELLHARGPGRVVLALGRLDLDLPVPVTLFDPMSAHEHTTHEHSHGGPKVYIATLAALLFLTVVTVFVAGFDFGNINIVVAWP
jgi:hypothetical protein